MKASTFLIVTTIITAITAVGITALNLMSTKKIVDSREN